ncbi:unnamed protein product, partial [Rhizoctonia solani]
MLFTPLLALATYAAAAPAGTSSSLSSAATAESSSSVATTTAGAVLPSPTVAYASDDLNGSYLDRYE